MLAVSSRRISFSAYLDFVCMLARSYRQSLDINLDDLDTFSLIAGSISSVVIVTVIRPHSTKEEKKKFFSPQREKKKTFRTSKVGILSFIGIYRLATVSRIICYMSVYYVEESALREECTYIHTYIHTCDCTDYAQCCSDFTDTSLNC